jgi:hypothetical protein
MHSNVTISAAPSEGVSVEVDKKSFKKMFPRLSKELDGSEGKVPMDSVRTDSEAAEKTLSDKFRNYEPTVVDFIRRCDTERQAEEIIAFLERRGELTWDYAEQLRRQLKKQGVRSFGSKKEDYYYFKQGGVC